MLYDARKSKRMSIEVAAHSIGCAARSLAGYEKPERKCIPPDVVKSAAEVYDKPELMPWYCLEKCPIGQVIATMPMEVSGITEVAIHICKDMEDSKRNLNRLVEIAYDGQITPDEYPDLSKIVTQMITLQRSIGSLVLLAMHSLPRDMQKTISINKKSRPFESGIRELYKERIAR